MDRKKNRQRERMRMHTYIHSYMMTAILFISTLEVNMHSNALCNFDEKLGKNERENENGEMFLFFQSRKF